MEELPGEGLGTVNDSHWQATLGGYTQQQFSQALGFPPGTKLTIKNISKSIHHTFNVVAKISGPPAKFPTSPSLPTNSLGRNAQERLCERLDQSGIVGYRRCSKGRHLSVRLRVPLSLGNARRHRHRDRRDARTSGDCTGSMNLRSPAFWLGALAVAAVTACTNGGGLGSIGERRRRRLAFAAPIFVRDRTRHTNRKDRRRERSRLGYGRGIHAREDHASARLRTRRKAHHRESF